jgi:hypothetical protein
MKFGAAAIHRTFGVPCGYCAPTRDKQSEAFLKRKRRLQAAFLFVLGEFSMIGRQMFGKILFRAGGIFDVSARNSGDARAMGGRDVVVAGDVRQAQPVIGEPIYKVGKYTGKGLNKPLKGEASPGTPSLAAFTNLAELFRGEFDDVVILRTARRIDRTGAASMSEAVRASYATDADKFLEVTAGMANCWWSLQDRNWFARRNRSALVMTPEGRAQVREIEEAEAPILMDGRKQRACGRDVADQVNAGELLKKSRSSTKRILSFRATRPKREVGSKPELIREGDFRGLLSQLQLCEGARVLLTHNERVEAGLMNGAVGRVRGFVWEQGADPHSQDTRKQRPVCVVVEFNDVNLGEQQATDEHGHLRFDEQGERVMLSWLFVVFLCCCFFCVFFFRTWIWVSTRRGGRSRRKACRFSPIKSMRSPKTPPSARSFR